MSLGSRVRKLEGGKSRMEVVFADGCLDAGEKQAFAETCRRERGLASDALILVLDATDRLVL